MSTSLSLRPLIRTRVLEVAKAPKPRRSTLVFAPLTPPNRLVSCTPGVCAMISCTVCAGECAISCAVMTAVDVPTMPLNCRTRRRRSRTPCDASVGAGPSCRCRCRATARGHDAARAPLLHRRSGLARVRFGSVGGVTSIGGNCSAMRFAARCAPEMPSESDEHKETGEPAESAAPLAAVMVEDMVQASV